MINKRPLQNINWDVKDVFLIYIAHWILFGLSTLIIYGTVKFLDYSNQFVLIPIAALITGIGTLLLINLDIKRYGCSLKDVGYNKFQIWRNIIIGILIGIIWPFFVNVIDYIFLNKSFWKISFEFSFYYLLYVLFTDFLSVISEETLITGFIYPVFRKKWGVILGIVIASFLFVFIHPTIIETVVGLNINKSTMLFINYFISAIIRISLYQITKSIIPSITVHFVGNVLMKLL